MLVGYSFLLPSPLATCQRLLELAMTADFWIFVTASMGRILAGFSLGLVTGCFLAVVTAASPWCHDFFKPFLAVVKSTPVASFIILALVFFSSSRVPIFATFLIVLPLVWANIFSGITKTDRQLLTMARGFDMGFGAKVRHIYVPSIVPYFSAAATTALGMAWKAGIAAEVISIPRNAIGTALYNSKIYLATADLFAWTVTIVLLSLALERLLVRLVNRIHRLPSAAGGAIR